MATLEELEARLETLEASTNILSETITFTTKDGVEVIVTGSELFPTLIRGFSYLGSTESFAGPGNKEGLLEVLAEHFIWMRQDIDTTGQFVTECRQDIMNLENTVNSYVTLNNQAITVSDEAKELGQQSLKKASEALIAAESANAKASNGEQLALNAFYIAQEVDEIAKKMETDLEDAIKRAEDAADEAEQAEKRAGEYRDAAEDVRAGVIEAAVNINAAASAAREAQVKAEEAHAKASNSEQLALNAFHAAQEAANRAVAKAEIIEGIPEHRLPFTATELEAKLSAIGSGTAAAPYDGSVTITGGES